MGTWLRRLLLYPALILGGCHFLMTGWPVPVWHIEELRSPVEVRRVTEGRLILADGRTATLPFIETLPADNPLFQAAITEGVEIAPDGEMYGLMWTDRVCGLDPVAYKKLRVNLSDLAGALFPEGIDDAIVHPEAIASLAEHKRIDPAWGRGHSRGRLAGYDWTILRAVRREFEFAAEQAAMRKNR